MEVPPPPFGKLSKMSLISEDVDPHAGQTKHYPPPPPLRISRDGAQGDPDPSSSKRKSNLINLHGKYYGLKASDPTPPPPPPPQQKTTSREKILTCFSRFFVSICAT